MHPMCRHLYSDSAADAEKLAITISTQLIPSLNTAIEFYIKFAGGQENPFAKGASQEAMKSFIHDRWEQLQKGKKLAESAETIFINFRHKSASALNTVSLAN